MMRKLLIIAMPLSGSCSNTDLQQEDREAAIQEWVTAHNVQLLQHECWGYRVDSERCAVLLGDQTRRLLECGLKFCVEVAVDRDAN